jgi:hypothetical protein
LPQIRRASHDKPPTPRAGVAGRIHAHTPTIIKTGTTGAAIEKKSHSMVHRVERNVFQASFALVSRGKIRCRRSPGGTS